ncbi:MAG: isoprenylcysteine carboxylmethyltransferase family protein [bacterium]|nr:isoprenylcysteine carboxylmethyltransferase family protein [bacterium]
MKFTIFYLLFLILSTILRFFRNMATRNRKGGIVYTKSIFAFQSGLYAILLISTIVEFFLVVDQRVDLFASLFGLILYLAGIGGREWAIKSLSEYWSADIRIREDHHLIKEGPYRYVRHPNLVCLLLEVNGLCLIPNAYYSLIFLWTVFLFSILFRIHLEEKALIEKFGQEYLDYKKEVPALIPLKFRRAK